jgi:membrane associated rhomboid family serine protease
VNYFLIGANVLAFLFELNLGTHLNSFVQVYGVVPLRVANIVTSEPGMIHYAIFPFFTSMFLHGGWLHLLGNMLYLYIFGDNVEDALGHVRYLLFYLACGVVASLTHLALNLNSQVPTVGASGAIAGVLGAYFLLYPKAKVVTLLPIFIFIQIIEIPAFLFLGFWFLLQFISGTAASASQNAGGVAWWAHIGGFAAGAVYTVFRYRMFRNKLRGAD